MSLSEKLTEWSKGGKAFSELREDVKEFIKKLKEASFTNGCKCDYCKKSRRAKVVSMNDIIELAGKELSNG